MDPHIGYCRLDQIRRNRTVKPLRELPDDVTAPIASNGVATFLDWMRQQRQGDRSRRINTEELIKRSHQAELDRDAKLQARLIQSHTTRNDAVTKGVRELSGKHFNFIHVQSVLICYYLLCIDMYRTRRHFIK